MLEPIAQAAATAGVSYKGYAMSSRSTADAIVGTAEQQDCDLICMASHGRRGIAGVLLGSETNKVLTHSNIPVLVVR